MPISLFPLEDSIIPAQDAVTRVINETCQIVFSYDRKILTRNLDMNWPSVIARTEQGVIGKKVVLNNESLYYRDHGICAYCERSISLRESTWDHVIPKSEGGRKEWSNIVSACTKCNIAKRNKKAVGIWRPKLVPFIPTYYDLLKSRRKFPITVDHEDWLHFLGDWQGEITVRA